MATLCLPPVTAVMSGVLPAASTSLSSLGCVDLSAMLSCEGLLPSIALSSGATPWFGPGFGFGLRLRSR